MESVTCEDNEVLNVEDESLEIIEENAPHAFESSKTFEDDDLANEVKDKTEVLNEKVVTHISHGQTETEENNLTVRTNSNETENLRNESDRVVEDRDGQVLSNKNAIPRGRSEHFRKRKAELKEYSSEIKTSKADAIEVININCGPDDSHVQALTAFVIWGRKEKRKIVQAFPDMDKSNINKLLGMKWKKMSFDQKEPFYEEQVRLNEMFKKQYPNYQARMQRCEYSQTTEIGQDLMELLRYGENASAEDVAKIIAVASLA